MRQKNDHYRPLVARKQNLSSLKLIKKYTGLKTAEKHCAKLKSQIFE